MAMSDPQAPPPLSAVVVAPVDPLLLAVQFLTVLPVRLRSAPTPRCYAQSTAWYPVIGMLVGLPSAMLAACLSGHLPATLVAGLVLVPPIILTGALHLDGFADSCDGLFAMKTREERLAILKDSRVGSFGAVGLLLLFLLRYGAIASLGRADLIPVMLLAPTLGRWSMVLGMRWFVPARRGSGLGALFQSERRVLPFAAAGLIAALLAAGLGGLPGLAALLVPTVVTVMVGRFAMARLGGVTGDIYGATSECVEVMVMVAWALATTWR